MRCRQCAARIFALSRCLSSPPFSIPPWGGAQPTIRSGDAHITLPRDRISVSFSRSSGAGGQNVNKVSTKAEVRFALDAAVWLAPEVRMRLEEQNSAHVNAEREVFVTSQRFRSQEANLEDALAKLTHMVRKAAAEPKVRLLRTGLSELAKDRNRDDKRHRSGVKAFRRGPTFDD